MRKRPADRGRAGMFLVLRGVRVIDGLGHVRERGTILIQNDRIAEVGDARHVSIPRGAIEVDARGMTVLPGLIDCHVHLCLGGEPDVVKTTQEEDPAGVRPDRSRQSPWHPSSRVGDLHARRSCSLHWPRGGWPVWNC